MRLSPSLWNRLRELNVMLARRGLALVESIDDGRTKWEVPSYPDAFVRVHECGDTPLMLELVIDFKTLHAQPLHAEIDFAELANALDRVGLRES